MSLCFTLCHSRGARASLPPIPEIALQIIQTHEGTLLSGVSMFINIQTIWSKWLLSKSCKYAREHEHHEHWQISKYVLGGDGYNQLILYLGSSHWDWSNPHINCSQFILRAHLHHCRRPLHSVFLLWSDCGLIPGVVLLVTQLFMKSTLTFFLVSELAIFYLS